MIMKIISLWMLLSIVVKLEFQIRQIDVQIAYIYGMSSNNSLWDTLLNNIKILKHTNAMLSSKFDMTE
jgi:hypothetical protein